MSTATERTQTPERPDYAQFVVCVVLLAVGGFLIYDALSLPGGYAKVDPVGPRLFPIVIGVGLVLMTVVLAIAGIPLGWCLFVVMLSPFVVAIGYETVGYRHVEADVRREAA